MGKTAVCYYSLEGTTAAAARALAEKTGADLVPLVPYREPPAEGIRKMIIGGAQAIFQTDPELPPMRDMVKGYEKLVLCYPVWAGRYPPAIGAFIDQGAVLDKKVYLLATSGSGNAEKSFAILRRKLGSVGVQDTLSLKGEDLTGLTAFAEKNAL